MGAVSLAHSLSRSSSAKPLEAAAALIWALLLWRNGSCTGKWGTGGVVTKIGAHCLLSPSETRSMAWEKAASVVSSVITASLPDHSCKTKI